MDVAGEFIYMASLLIHIKSKMLLPRSPVEAAEGEAEDPRRELVERLLEHERFKNAAQMLHAEAADRRSDLDQSGHEGISRRRGDGAGDRRGHGRPGARLPRDPGAGQEPSGAGCGRGCRDGRPDDRLSCAAAW